MGREIKRVALDFKWPINKVWKGFLNPYHSQECPECDSGGYNPATQQISDDWYDFEGTGRKWCYNITQDEVDALVEYNRLWDFTRVWTQDIGWQDRADGYKPTADEVNRWAQHGMGHDSINHHICVEARAKRLGVWGYCSLCNGNGEIWYSPEIKKLHDEWQEQEPPAGDGWQVWETISEGSPISPVFVDSSACIRWLVGEGYSPESAKKFVLEDQWTMKYGSG